MASAFASGFKMGGDMFDSTERNRLAREQLDMAKAADARAAEAHNLQMQSARRIEDATQAVTNASSLGLRVPGAQESNEAAQRESLRRFEIADQNAGDSGERAQYAAPTGIQPTYRPATDLELNGLQSTLAAARGDVQGMEALRLGRKGIQYDEGYKKHIADWNSKSDDERADLISKLSYDTGVKGFGTWTPGKGKQAGYMTYLPPTGDAVKLSDKEAGEVYALSNLMSIDPTRARGELDKVSDKVRAVAAQVFSAEHQGVTANNQATHNAAADRAAATSANAAATTAKAHADYIKAQTGVLEDAREGRIAAAKIADQFSALSDADKSGPVGLGLMRQYNMVIAKAGVTLPLGGGNSSGNKLPQTLTDAQKIAYEAAIKELGGMNGSPSLPQRAAIASKYNLPPEMLGASGMPDDVYGNKKGTGLQPGSKVTPSNVDLSPVGSVAIAPSQSAAMPQAEPPTLLGVAGNGLNVRMPDGSSRFISYGDAQKLGVLPPLPGGQTVLGASGNGLNVRMPDGSTKFVPNPYR
jgi:hypothetical protein